VHCKRTAEGLAETLEPGDVVPIEGKLAYQKGKTKYIRKLIVVCFGVKRFPELQRTIENLN
jgi:hypothetical protein